MEVPKNSTVKTACVVVTVSIGGATIIASQCPMSRLNATAITVQKQPVLLTSELHPPLPTAMQVTDPTSVKALCDFKVVHHLSPYLANEATLAEAAQRSVSP